MYDPLVLRSLFIEMDFLLKFPFRSPCTQRIFYIFKSYTWVWPCYFKNWEWKFLAFLAFSEFSKTQIQLLGAGIIAPDIICIPGMSIQVPENCRPVGKWCNLWFHLAHEFPVALLIDCQNCSLSLLWNQRLNICNLEGSIGS